MFSALRPREVRADQRVHSGQWWLQAARKRWPLRKVLVRRSTAHEWICTRESACDAAPVPCCPGPGWRPRRTYSKEEHNKDDGFCHPFMLKVSSQEYGDRSLQEFCHGVAVLMPCLPGCAGRTISRKVRAHCAECCRARHSRSAIRSGGSVFVCWTACELSARAWMAARGLPHECRCISPSPGKTTSVTFSLPLKELRGEGVPIGPLFAEEFFLRAPNEERAWSGSPLYDVNTGAATVRGPLSFRHRLSACSRPIAEAF